MVKITPEELIEFVRTKESFQLKTIKQQKRFTVRLNQDELEFVPLSSKKTRAHEIKYLRRVCDRFSRINSFRPSDYGELTVNASYTLSLIQAYLAQLPPEEDFEKRLAEEIKRSERDSREARQKRLTNAPKKPLRKLVVAKIYLRNADVIVEVHLRANGACEGCGKPSPFKRKSDDKPYLEVHHKKPLADGGEDTIDNAMALCPNCHRKAHYG